MKNLKKAAICFILVLMVGLTACSGSGDKNKASSGNADTNSNKTDKVDISKYPSDINEWTSQDFIDYFTAAGVFTNKDWTWIQDHATYWSGTAIDEGCGYMDEEGEILICIYTFDTESKEADVPAYLDYVKENKKLGSEEGDFPLDHKVGNVVFSYVFTTDDDIYNAMDNAYNDLVDALGVTADF